MSTQLSHCSFCTKHKDLVNKLIVSHDVAICNECIDLCNSLLFKNQNDKISNSKTFQIPDPKQIYNYLNGHVIAQDSAKIILSVAIANHFKRIKSSEKLTKANVMMIGPTGTGKTLMAKSVAKYLNVPFVIGDATCLTEAGYVGDDVESLISRLLIEANYDVESCQRGIIFLDEVDKISRKSESSSITKDVSGEGVQQALLKLIEGTKCRVPSNGGKKGNNTDLVEIDTSNILFIAGGAFIGLEKILQKRIQGTSIGFSASMENNDLESSEILPDDLVKYGIIPEFVGRFSNIVRLHELSKTQLIDILTSVNGNLIDQYKWLFEQDGVKLEFDQESLDLIAEKTLQTKTGARGLHNELERILLPHMFDLPQYRRQNILAVSINKLQVNRPKTLAQENQ